MEKICCLIADIPQAILADIIQKITEKDSGIEVVRRVDEKNDIPQIVKESDIDVLITGVSEATMSGKLNAVLDLSPQIVGIGIGECGRRVCVCVENIGPDAFVDLVKTAARKRHRKHQLGGNSLLGTKYQGKLENI